MDAVGNAFRPADGVIQKIQDDVPVQSVRVAAAAEADLLDVVGVDVLFVLPQFGDD